MLSLLIYSDLRDVDAINALPDNKFHRHVDVPIIKAGVIGVLYCCSWYALPFFFLSPLCPCSLSESASEVNGANLVGQGIYSACPAVHWFRYFSKSPLLENILGWGRMFCWLLMLRTVHPSAHLSYLLLHY